MLVIGTNGEFNIFGFYSVIQSNMVVKVVVSKIVREGVQAVQNLEMIVHVKGFPVAPVVCEIVVQLKGKHADGT
jgi:hypothetical protein